MYVDMVAPQCRQRYLHSSCDHPMDDCFVHGRKIAWSIGSLSEVRGNDHCGPESVLMLE